MSDYKLVPVEPTAEMVESAESAYMLFGDMELALMMAVLAAPAVQGEAADALEHVAGERKTVDRTLIREVFLRNGFKIKDGRDDLADYVYEAAFDLLETAAQAPDVAALVEALTMARETIASALRANAPDYFTTDADIARHVVIQRIDAALAAHCKQGGEV